MIIDLAGAEYRSGRLILPRDWKAMGGRQQWWAPEQDSIKHYTVVARDRQTKVVWQGNFQNFVKALQFWQAIQDGHGHPHHRAWDLPTPAWHPGLSIDAFIYQFLTVETFNSTPGGGTWTCPAGVTTTEVLDVAGGGGGGGYDSVTGGGGWRGGGGGGGGIVHHAAKTVVPSTAYTLTVGPGGAAGTTSGSPTAGAVGSNSVFDNITALGGGGGREGFGDFVDRAGNTGGSGSGAGMTRQVSGGGAATQASSGGGTGYGNAGGASASDANAGGGGGANAAASGATPGTGKDFYGDVYSAGGAPGTAGAATANSGNGGNGNLINLAPYAGATGRVILRYTIFHGFPPPRASRMSYLRR